MIYAGLPVESRMLCELDMYIRCGKLCVYGIFISETAWKALLEDREGSYVILLKWNLEK